MMADRALTCSRASRRIGFANSPLSAWVASAMPYLAIHRPPQWLLLLCPTLSRRHSLVKPPHPSCPHRRVRAARRLRPLLRVTPGRPQSPSRRCVTVVEPQSRIFVGQRTRTYEPLLPWTTRARSFSPPLHRQATTAGASLSCHAKSHRTTSASLSPPWPASTGSPRFHCWYVISRP